MPKLDWDGFYENGKDLESFQDIRCAILDCFPLFSSIEFMEIKFSNHISNTHCAPHGKPRNFVGARGIPTGYPGWKGRLRFAVNRPFSGFASELFRGSRIYTASGGGGALIFQYDVKLFAEEWPGLAAIECFNRLTT